MGSSTQHGQQGTLCSWRLWRGERGQREEGIHVPGPPDCCALCKLLGDAGEALFQVLCPGVKRVELGLEAGDEELVHFDVLAVEGDGTDAILDV